MTARCTLLDREGTAVARTATLALPNAHWLSLAHFRLSSAFCVSVYAHYTSAIRTEYIHYPYETFLSGRLGVLQSFLQRERIYFTRAFQRKESKARFNLRKEIERIQAAPELQHMQ